MYGTVYKYFHKETNPIVTSDYAVSLHMYLFIYLW
jgi:hypothetical protein